MKVYAGNLPYRTSESALRSLFAAHGREVESVSIVCDPYTGQSRGFAFVEMRVDDEAVAAINELDGFLLDGRPMRVNRARSRRAPRHREGRGWDARRSARW